MIRTRLRRLGFAAVKVVASLAGARLHLDEAAPAVVLLDLGLPDGQGPDVVRTMRSLADTSVIIVCSAHRDTDIVRDSVMAGADDFLSKSPLTSEDLERCLLVNLERTERERAPRESLGLADRSVFDSRLDEEWRRNQRLGVPMSLLLIRPRAHEAEGRLQSVSEALHAMSRRATEFAALFDEGTFALILGGIGADDATAFAAKLTARIGAPPEVALGGAEAGHHRFDRPDALRERAEDALERSASGSIIILPAPTE